jgi:MoaA/NifB/PqqE/SkfB family radical SAM enzyme
MRCRHCYAGALYGDAREELGLEDSLRLLRNLYSVGVQNLSLYGGEPLLRGDLAELVREAHTRGTGVYVVTNGVLLTAARAEELMDAGLSGFGVSLDAGTRETYRKIRGSDLFPRVLGNVRSLVQSIRDRAGSTTVSLSLGFVLSRVNQGDTAAVIRLAHDLGADHVILTPLAHVGNARNSWAADALLSPGEFVDAAETAMRVRTDLGLSDDFVVMDFATHRLLDYIREAWGLTFPLPPRRCSPLKGGLFVRADGVAFPCKGTVAEMGLKAGGYSVQGHSLLEHPLSWILNSPDFVRLFEMASPETLLRGLPACRECEHFLVECGPCPIAALQGKPYAEFCHDYPVGLICQAASDRGKGLKDRNHG